MKAKILIILLMISFSINANEYNTYELENVHDFKASHYGVGGDRDLSLILEGTNPGPDGPGLFFIEDQLAISDQAYWNDQRRTIFLTKDYNFEKILQDSFFGMNVIRFENIYIGENASFIQLFSIVDKWEMEMYSSQDRISIIKSANDIYYQDDTLFIYDKSNTLWAIKGPSMDDSQNKANLIKEEDIVREIKDGVFKGLTIDDKKRLFLNNELQTIKYKTFVKYWSEKSPDLIGNILDGVYSFERLSKSNYSNYLGRDSDDNYYWSSRKTIVVFNNEGLLIERFKFDSKKSDTFPAVSPEGDIFFMNYDTDKVTLYKIPRQW